MKSKKFNSYAVAFGAIILFIITNAFACGPDFPNNLLDAGDQAVFQPPVADFRGELMRMKLVTTSTRSVPLMGGQTYAEQSANADLADLTAALKRNKVSSEQATAIISFHMAQRAKLNAYLASFSERNYPRPWVVDANGHLAEPTITPPILPDCQIAPGLPPEFALYFKGYLAWQNDENWKAAEYWQDVLDLPANERHYKSTWAAFMQGKYLASMTNNYEDAEALKSLEQVREFAKNGFADSLGLATASVGLEAQIYLRQGNYERAIELYLEQFAAGDDSAVESLRTAAARAMAENGATPGQLSTLAKNIRTRRVITAYFISRHRYEELNIGNSDPSTKPAYNPNRAWLNAVEKSGVRDVDSAEQLALAAYQADDMEAAQRWVQLAANRPVAQWLQAKLFMRDGKVDAAAKLLAKLTRKFPATNSDTNAPSNLAGNLFITVSDMWGEQISASQQVVGELGVLRLARREYVEALDALLRSGYWMDAAYIAERVLTTDELKVYVDRKWPVISPAKNELAGVNEKNPGEQIRYLLARRLARETHYVEARNYYPDEWQTNLAVFTAGLRDGEDEKLSDRQRGRALFASAWIARTNGMELFGTELEPDWAIYGGNFEFNAIWQSRATNILTDKVNLASTNELARAASHHANPETRFHYRNQAADLAWAAAKFMPDNSAETAQMLCLAGSWLQNRDPAGAERFYKALVRRCRQTDLGAAADDLHWFPTLDEDGNVTTLRLQLIKLIPETTNAVSMNGIGEVFSTEFPVPGRKYAIHRGDTIVAIATAAGRMDQTIDVPKILAANPGLDPTKMRIGRLIIIPSGDPGIRQPHD